MNDEMTATWRAKDMEVKECKGRLYLALDETIVGVLGAEDPAVRMKVVDKVVATAEFGEAVRNLLQGFNCNEWSSTDNQGVSTHSGDKLRQVLSEMAHPAAVSLIKQLMEEVQRLAGRLRDKDKHIAKLLELWPESYKKYVPKEEWTFAPTQYITAEAVTRLIEEAKQREAKVDEAMKKIL